MARRVYITGDSIQIQEESHDVWRTKYWGVTTIDKYSGLGISLIAPSFPDPGNDDEQEIEFRGKILFYQWGTQTTSTGTTRYLASYGVDPDEQLGYVTLGWLQPIQPIMMLFDSDIANDGTPQTTGSE